MGDITTPDLISLCRDHKKLYGKTDIYLFIYLFGCLLYFFLFLFSTGSFPKLGHEISLTSESCLGDRVTGMSYRGNLFPLSK